MTSIKVKFRTSNIAGSEGTIYYQIIHERVARQCFTGLKLFQNEWDNKSSSVIVNLKSHRLQHILSVKTQIIRDVERILKIIRKMEFSMPFFTTDDIIYEFIRFVNDYSLNSYMSKIISQLKQHKRIRTAETYQSTLNAFNRFMENKTNANEKLLLDGITAELIEEFEAWQQMRGITQNTISFYNRILRAVYNRAVDDGVIDNKYPFRRVYTGIDRTHKRALSLAEICKIKKYNLSYNPKLEYARDMFILSFMLRGISFVDLAFLKKNNLNNGRLIYRRRKTGQLLIIGWTKEMQQIIDKYNNHTTEYLLPIIKKRNVNELSAYRNASYNLNRHLKKLGLLVGISGTLTFYVARHSWATAAKEKGIQLSVISEAMGHDSLTTTQIYLASLDTSLVDHANSLILSSI